MRSTVCLTTAPMRTGKTYMRGAVFLAREWLPFNDGLHVSNMPMKPKALADYCIRHYGDDKGAEDRVIRIPDEMRLRWLEPAVEVSKDKWTNTDGPWDEFGPGKRWPLSGTHIAIDEAHLYIPRAENLHKRRLWRNWLREIGHHGATVEFITQNLEALDKDIEKISELRYTIASRVSDRDPFFKIPMEHWYELKGMLCGEWRPVIQQFEKRRVDKGWAPSDTKLAELKPEFYELYESFSRPQNDDGDGDTSEAVHVVEHEFQKRTKLGLLRWFFLRHIERWIAVFILSIVFVWLCFFGGIPWLMRSFVVYTQMFSGKKASAGESPKHSQMSDKAPLAELVPAGNSDISEGNEVKIFPETVLYSGSEGTYTAADFGQLVGDRGFLETQVQVQEEELEVLRSENSEVIMLTPDFVTFASGERVAVGGQIKRSGLDAYVTSISYERREVLFSDGSVRGLRLSQPKERASILPRLEGGERGAGGAGRGSRGRDRNGAVAHDGRERYPHAGNDAGVVYGDGSIDSLGGGVGHEYSESGGSGRASGGGPRAYSSSSGRGDFAGGEPVLSRPPDP